jgi:hypothetical protein
VVQTWEDPQGSVTLGMLIATTGASRAPLDMLVWQNKFVKSIFKEGGWDPHQLYLFREVRWRLWRITEASRLRSGWEKRTMDSGCQLNKDYGGREFMSYLQPLLIVHLVTESLIVGISWPWSYILPIFVQCP